jgi:hypothetical protein
VLFFTGAAKPLFEAWKKYAASIDFSVRYIQDDKRVGVMPQNDQGGFAQAIEMSGYLPFVLPMSWNFRPIWQLAFFGPLRTWHDYCEMPPLVIEANAYYERADAIIQFANLKPSQ